MKINEESGEAVKKLIVILTVILLLRIGSLIYFDSKLLEEPIVVAAVYDEGFGNLNIGYITNRLMPQELHYFEYAGDEYYPEGVFFSHGTSNAHMYRNYKYQSLYSTTFNVREPQKKNQWRKPGEGRVYFTDGTSQAVTFDVNPKVDVRFLTTIMSSGGTDGHEGIYVAEKEFLLEEVDWNERIEGVSIALNRKSMELPLTTPISIAEGDRIEIRSTGGLALFLGDISYLFLRGKDSRGNAIELPIFLNMNEAPSSEWIDQRIAEGGQ